jgi:hypothetical protein
MRINPGRKSKRKLFKLQIGSNKQAQTKYDKKIKKEIQFSDESGEGKRMRSRLSFYKSLSAV